MWAISLSSDRQNPSSVFTILGSVIFNPHVRCFFLPLVAKVKKESPHPLNHQLITIDVN